MMKPIVETFQVDYLLYLPFSRPVYSVDPGNNNFCLCPEGVILQPRFEIFLQKFDLRLMAIRILTEMAV